MSTTMPTAPKVTETKILQFSPRRARRLQRCRFVGASLPGHGVSSQLGRCGAWRYFVLHGASAPIGITAIPSSRR
jgi:hypothetical protein